MEQIGRTWRGWVGLTLALILAAASIIADFQFQRTVKAVYTAAIEDAKHGQANLQDIDDLIGQTRAAIEFSILAADDTGSIDLAPDARRQLTVEVNGIVADAEFGLAETLDRVIHLDARMDTLSLLSGRDPERLMTPNVISLRGTIVEAAANATSLLATDAPLTGDEIDSMRGRLDGARQLEGEIFGALGDSMGTLEQVRSTIRWRIHLLAALVFITLSWYGYQSWQATRAGPRGGTKPDPD